MHMVKDHPQSTQKIGKGAKEQSEKGEKQDEKNVEEAIDAVKTYIEKADSNADDGFESAENSHNILKESV